MTEEKLAKRSAAVVEVIPANRSGLTTQQTDELIGGGVAVMTSLAEVARSLADIAHIRATADGDVARIEAETRQLREGAAAQLRVYVEKRVTMADRGRIVVELLEHVTRALKDVPDLDPASRKALIDSLPSLVQSAIRG